MTSLSDTILRYVPADPYWQPSPENASKAISLLETIVPGADEVKSSFEDEVRFYDPGENWSGVECSACGADAEEWWGKAMETASADGFKDLNTGAPCCGATVSLNDLRYVWPMREEAAAPHRPLPLRRRLNAAWRRPPPARLHPRPVP
ncbi:hypothetical protein [Rhizobium leguminosarum]|uniref:hypothetical protein n=1 Tax=Rhizobium leguminosarum TaxID=384 RepID=UPI0021BC09B3|nr:hypothetical protein [Rhizobium leguminosarum]